MLGEVLPRPALAQDLDGDAVPELLAFGNPDDIGQAGALVRAYEWGGAAGWSPRWEFSTDGVADLDGAALAGPDSWTSGEFDGAPGTDLAFAVLRRPSPSLVFLSGVDGSLVASVPRAAIPFGVARPVAIDLVDALGVAGTDGIDEVVQPGTQHIELVSPLTGSVLRRELRYYTTATAVLARESGVAVTVVEGLHGNVTSNPFGAMEFGIDGIEQRWGPQEVPIPYGRPTLVAIDRVPGPGRDVVYASGTGSVSTIDGVTGAELSPPLWLHGGGVSSTPVAPPEPLSALIGVDLDGDGGGDLVAGSTRGWLYGLKLAGVGAATQLWSMNLGGGIFDLAAADVDGGGESELLVAAVSGEVFVVDGGSASLVIDSPATGECLDFAQVEVSGTAPIIASVSLSANGVPGDRELPVVDGTWSGNVNLQGRGAQTILATGLGDSGETLLLASRIVEFGGDQDGDGVTECGGDCDDTDASRAPGLQEACEDDVEQDCDGEDSVCPEPADDDDSAGDDDSAATISGGCTGGADCGSTVVGSEETGALGLLALLLPVLTRRRQRGGGTRG